MSPQMAHTTILHWHGDMLLHILGHSKTFMNLCINSVSLSWFYFAFSHSLRSYDISYKDRGSLVANCSSSSSDTFRYGLRQVAYVPTTFCNRNLNTPKLVSAIYKFGYGSWLDILPERQLNFIQWWLDKGVECMKRFSIFIELRSWLSAGVRC